MGGHTNTENDYISRPQECFFIYLERRRMKLYRSEESLLPILLRYCMLISTMLISDAKFYRCTSQNGEYRWFRKAKGVFENNNYCPRLLMPRRRTFLISLMPRRLLRDSFLDKIDISIYIHHS